MSKIIGREENGGKKKCDAEGQRNGTKLVFLALAVSTSSGQACISEKSPVLVAPLIMKWSLGSAADGHNSLGLAATSRHSH